MGRTRKSKTGFSHSRKKALTPSILVGEYELALDSLERAFELGDPYAIPINRVSLYDPLRDNPRFQALLAKMNLWP